MHIAADTLDDLIRLTFQAIRDLGSDITPSKGAARELTGVLLELRDPLARLSLTETKGTPFSCLGELCWYLAGRNDLASIEYYIRGYSESADDGIIHGGYGPRLFNWKGLNQLNNVVECLNRQDSRQAVIQLFDAQDIQRPRKKDVPCTCTLQFFSREGTLSMLVSMRSNDAFLGLPHDVFCFTMLQELIARQVGLELGGYKHVVGSLHLYEDRVADADQYLGEGWQATDLRMPPMPLGDPWGSVHALLEEEVAIRTSAEKPNRLQTLDPYWQDLGRLLEIYGCFQKKDGRAMAKLADEMHAPVYRLLIMKKIAMMAKPADNGQADA